MDIFITNKISVFTGLNSNITFYLVFENQQKGFHWYHSCCLNTFFNEEQQW